MQNEDDLTGRARDYGSVQVDVGTVGWDSQEEYYLKGDPSKPAGYRHTLVYVTIFRGKDPDVRPKAGVAHGRKIICCLNGGTHRIPPKGSLVYVLVPEGMEESPGAAMIIGVREDDPERLEEDRAIIDYGDIHVILRAKSVAIESYEGEFVSVGEPRSGGTSGVTIQAKAGTGAIWQVGVASMFVSLDGDAKSVLQMTPTKAELMHKTSGFMRVGNGEIVALSKGKAAYIAANTFVGRTPVGGGAAAVWSIPPGPAPVPSLSVFIGM